MSGWVDRTHLGDCRDLLLCMIQANVKVQCVVTSPPYYGLRDYGVDGQIGLERTLAEWVKTMGEVFGLVWDVLRDDGVLWVNLGDAYTSGNRSSYRAGRSRNKGHLAADGASRPKTPGGLKEKDLMGQPWRVAFALQEHGWHLRADCIWHKLNPMPESVRDRPTKAHEYVFMFSKSQRYHYDAAAIAEPVSANTHPRRAGVVKTHTNVSGWKDGAGSHSTIDHAKGAAGFRSTKFPRVKASGSMNEYIDGVQLETRNIRTVWSLPTEPQSEAHFACFPSALVKRCVMSSTRPGDTVLDPFMGSGTTARVAAELGRHFIGCELNPEYIEIQDRIGLQGGMAV